MPKTKTHIDQHTAYSNLYDYFNAKLFDGKLAPVMLNFSRHAKSFGFFVAERWIAADGMTIDGKLAKLVASKHMHEISLNPDYLARNPRDTCAVLVHEMAHAWQHEHGKPPRGGYHDRQWGTMMKAIGLRPSSTHEPGGSETGDRMGHYIIEDGAFARAFAKLPKSYLLPLVALPIGAKERKAKPASKVKYTCPQCEANVWGKPGLHVMCGDCTLDAGEVESPVAFEAGEVTG